jgi:hypothetical protein
MLGGGDDLRGLGGEEGGLGGEEGGLGGEEARSRRGVVEADDGPCPTGK